MSLYRICRLETEAAQLVLVVFRSHVKVIVEGEVMVSRFVQYLKCVAL